MCYLMKLNQKNEDSVEEMVAPLTHIINLTEIIIIILKKKKIVKNKNKSSCSIKASKSKISKWKETWM